MQFAQSLNVDAEKKRITSLLDDARKATMAAIGNMDGDKTILYEQGNWCLKDIIAHIAAYDFEIVKSLQAYRDGGEYKMSMSGEMFNNEQYEKHKSLPAAEIYLEWVQARDQFKAAINEMPAGKFDGQLLYPWGSRGTISFLVEDTIAHEKDHRADIAELAAR